jgi:CheY-like chemotaxis protein
MADEPTEAGMTVLVIEDDFDLRDALVPVLEYDGHRVVSAANGQEALDRLQTMANPPSVILLDLMMPVMDGEQFRTEQLRDPNLASIPVVVMSAHSRAEERAARMGAAGCLVKPIDIDTLLGELRRNGRRRVSASMRATPGTTLRRR